MGNKQRPQILIVEDEIDLLEYYKFELEEDSSYDIHTAQTVQEAQALLAQIEFDVVLTDLKLRRSKEEGFELLNFIKRSSGDTQVIVVTGIGGTEDARRANNLGDGYLTKPLNFDTLRQVVGNSIKVKQQKVQARASILARRKKNLPTPEPFVAESRVMHDLIKHAINVAKTDKNIVIIGKLGTGKGLLAEGIHFGSGRKHFELINCSSLSEPTLERILFGDQDEETDQHYSSIFERLENGTLILDRVTELSLSLQEKLRSTLSGGKDVSQPVNVRIISMDKIDLEEAVNQGTFLAELYKQLAEVSLTVPLLRQRRDPDGSHQDIFPLMKHFMPENATISLSLEVKEFLASYPFPGNVRELKQAIRSAIGRATGPVILMEHLPSQMRQFAERPTLGVSYDQLMQNPVLCPHSNAYCDQVDTIATTHHRAIGVFVHLSENAKPEFIKGIHEQIESIGGMTVFPPKQLDTSITPLCAVCVPIQFCHYAIVDISQDQALYEVGLLHALGVPVLILKHVKQSVPSGLGAKALIEYHDWKHVLPTVKDWLSEMALP